MRLLLNEDLFVSDYFIFSGRNKTLYFNLVDEDIVTQVNIACIDNTTGITTECASVIGLGNEHIMLGTEDVTLLSKVLQIEHFSSVWVDFYDE